MPEDKDDEHAEDQPDAEEEHQQDESEEDECDEAIAGLLERIDQLEQRNTELESRLAELERQLAEHGIKFKHEPLPDAGPGDVEPEPAHWYFKRLRRE